MIFADIYGRMLPCYKTRISLVAVRIFILTTKEMYVFVYFWKNEGSMVYLK